MKVICDHADQCGLDLNECDHSRSHEQAWGCAGWCSELQVNTECVVLPARFQDSEELND